METFRGQEQQGNHSRIMHVLKVLRSPAAPEPDEPTKIKRLVDLEDFQALMGSGLEWKRWG